MIPSAVPAPAPHHPSFSNPLTRSSGPVLRLLLLATLLSCIFLPASVQAAGTPVTYSIVHLSDTQNLATYYPGTYNLTFSYLESQKIRYNISAIIITGDLVNTWNKKSEWDAYIRARNHTTIPVYTIAGNHDVDYGKQYGYYTRYSGEPETNYVTTVGDFDLVGINYVKTSLSPKEFSRIRTALANSSRSQAIIATHWYMEKNRALSPLGKDIAKDLIVKPTLILTGHKHADFVQKKNISGFPVIEDMTNYQNGLPGGNGDKNYSAGTLYAVTSADGQVSKITAQVIHIYPQVFSGAEKTVFELPPVGGSPAGTIPSNLSSGPVSAGCAEMDVICRFQNLVEHGWWATESGMGI
ncbi:metallophosphoesterase [Methanoregula sp.]|uniref:metallophosphoesterase family protein n=1 Tax=Methanoregula sp. TaxID=2052170 RepID=UPI0035652097